MTRIQIAARIVIFSGPSVVLGAWVMRHNGIPVGVWSQNLVGLVLVIAFCFAPIRFSRIKEKRFSSPRFVMVGVLLALALTFGFPGLAGVHRWINLGSLRVNVAEALTPAFLIALTCVSNAEISSASFLTSAIALLFIFQPDAGQGTAFLGAVAVFLTRQNQVTAKLSWGLFSLFLITLTILWMRQDPLPGVPHVEGIVGMAFESGAFCGVVAFACLLFLPIPFALLYLQNTELKYTGLVLTVYYSLSLLSALTGKFPVILMGYGLSPIFGYGLAILWACAQRARNSDSDADVHQNG